MFDINKPQFHYKITLLCVGFVNLKWEIVGWMVALLCGSFDIAIVIIMVVRVIFVITKYIIRLLGWFIYQKFEVSSILGQTFVDHVT